MPGRLVSEIMTTKVITVREDAPFKEIAEKLTIYDISAVPVVDEEGHLLGIVSEADLLSKEAHTPAYRPQIFMLGPAGRWLRKAGGRTARELMTRDPVTTTPEESLRNAARQMTRTGVKRLPVIDPEGELVGIISRHDVLDVFDRSDSQLRAEVKEALSKLAFLNSPHADVVPDVNGGVVQLTGTVRFTSDVAVAENVVAKVEGVVGVDNELAARHVAPEILPL